ncbi:MAG: hypothetical protein IT372_37055 [Polyangiaceae bacterium]|nr:hypothetical protein [Polyangiaceae bacterium]
MGLWPFGREPEDVESASRVVTAATRDARRVRATLTLHFEAPLTQSAADDAADRCAVVAEAIFREVPGHEHLLGNEDALSSTLAMRLPPGIPRVRSVELAAIHVVGDPSSLGRRRSSAPPALAHPPGSPDALTTPVPSPYGHAPYGSPSVPAPTVAIYPPAPTTPPGSGALGAEAPDSALRPMPPASVPPGSMRYHPPASVPPGSMHYPASVPSPPSGSGYGSPSTLRPPPSSVAGRRRTSSSTIRAISASLAPPPGSGPAEIGAALAPLLRDAFTRLLLGFLRAHDLLMVRHVTLDEGAAELLAALLPVSEAPPGEFEASRAMELGRWRVTLGPEAVDALRAEAGVLGTSLAALSLQRSQIPPEGAAALLGGLCAGSAAAEAAPDPDPRYTQAPVLPEAAQRVARLLGHPEIGPLELALAPLIQAVSDDMDVLAQLARVALGAPA